MEYDAVQLKINIFKCGKTLNNKVFSLDFSVLIDILETLSINLNICLLKDPQIVIVMKILFRYYVSMDF